MKTDQQIYTLLGADPEFLAILTDGVRVRAPYHFEAIEVKGLDRRCDGVLIPDALPAGGDPESIWVIEFQAQRDPAIYHRLLVEMGLIGERHLDREVRGMILFATPAHDPRTQPWHRLAQQPDPPVRVACLQDILVRLEARDPLHPLLAVFLPYRIDDRERLRREGSAAMARIQDAALPPPARANALAVFWSWLTVRFNELSYREILHMFGIQTAFEETRAYQDILAMGMEMGMEKGGREEAGRLVMRLLQRRLGPLCADLEARIRALPLPVLEDLAEALSDFDSLAALETWLARR